MSFCDGNYAEHVTFLWQKCLVQFIQASFPSVLLNKIQLSCFAALILTSCIIHGPFWPLWNLVSDLHRGFTDPLQHVAWLLNFINIFCHYAASCLPLPYVFKTTCSNCAFQIILLYHAFLFLYIELFKTPWLWWTQSPYSTQEKIVYNDLNKVYLSWNIGLCS